MATCKDCLFNCYTDDLDRVEETCNFFLDNNQYAEVVRCKDCKHYTEKKNASYGGHFCERIVEFVDMDDFCSYGERKDNV